MKIRSDFVSNSSSSSFIISADSKISVYDLVHDIFELNKDNMKFFTKENFCKLAYYLFYHFCVFDTAGCQYSIPKEYQEDYNYMIDDFSNDNSCWQNYEYLCGELNKYTLKFTDWLLKNQKPVEICKKFDDDSGKPIDIDYVSGVKLIYYDKIKDLILKNPDTKFYLIRQSDEICGEFNFKYIDVCDPSKLKLPPYCKLIGQWWDGEEYDDNEE